MSKPKRDYIFEGYERLDRENNRLRKACEAAERALDKIERNQEAVISALRTSKDPGIVSATTALFEGVKRNLAHSRTALQKVGLS